MYTVIGACNLIDKDKILRCTQDDNLPVIQNAVKNLFCVIQSVVKNLFCVIQSVAKNPNCVIQSVAKNLGFMS